MSIVRRLGRRILKRVGGSGSADGPSTSPAPPPSAAVRDPQELSDDPVVIADLWAIRAAIEPTDRPILINHWATWCDGCVAELPDLVKLHARYGDKVRFLGISWETFQASQPHDKLAEHIQAFCEEQGVTWQTLMVTDAPDDLFAGLELKVRTIPQTVLVTADGDEVFRCEEPLHDDALTKLGEALAAATA